MSYQAYSVNKKSGSVVVPFDPPFANPPVVLTTPYWKGQGSAVGHVPTVSKVSADSATIVGGNYADNYFVNVLAVERDALSIGELPVLVDSTNKTTGVVKIDAAAPSPSVNLLSAFWDGQGAGVGNVETLNTMDSGDLTVVSGNAASNYFVNSVSTVVGSFPSAQAGIANKVGGDAHTVYFPRAWQTPPTVFVSPWWANANSGVGSIETISDVTEDSFTVVSGNRASNYFIDWLAVPATPTKSRARSTSELENAAALLKEWVPEEANSIDAHLNSIITHIQAPVGARVPRSMVDVEYTSLPPEPRLAPRDTSCGWACALAGVDGIMLAGSIVGLRAANNRRIADAVLRAAGQQPLSGLAHLFQDLEAAVGAWEKAKNLFKILSGFYNIGAFRAIFRALRYEMRWYEWALAGLTFLAQVVAWVTSDGVAFVAEVALVVPSAIYLGVDIASAVAACT